MVGERTNNDIADRLSEAVALRRAGKLDEAAGLCESILADASGHAGALNLLGLIDMARGRHREAAERFSAAVSAKPDSAPYLANLGGALTALGKDREALAALAKATELAPERHESWLGLASLHQKAGRTADVLAAYRRVVALKPDHVQALYQLAVHGDPSVDADKVAALAEAAEAAEAGAQARRMLHYAAAEAYMRDEQAAPAMRHFKAANDIRKAELEAAGKAFDADAHAEAVTAAIAASSPERLAKARMAGASSAAPVFLVGVPQSGTRMLGRLLDDHPDLFVMDETENIARLARELGWPDKIDKVPATKLKAIADKYIETMEAAHPGYRRLVDATPTNFMHLGLIARLFPQARVVHVQRQAMDCCVWGYMRNLNHHRAYSHDLIDIGRYYIEYERLMAFHQARPPLNMMTVRLEEFAEAPETVLKRMLRFLGVMWRRECDPANLDMTAVRGSIGRWRLFEPHLEPLKRALSGEMEPDPDMALDELFPPPPPPAPEPAPEAEPAPEPEPEPEPVSEPEPEPVSEPRPDPVPEAEPEPAPPRGLAALAGLVGTSQGDTENETKRRLIDILEHLSDVIAPSPDAPPSRLSDEAAARVADRQAARATWSLAGLVDETAAPAPEPESVPEPQPAPEPAPEPVPEPAPEPDVAAALDVGGDAAMVLAGKFEAELGEALGFGGRHG